MTALTTKVLQNNQIISQESTKDEYIPINPQATTPHQAAELNLLCCKVKRMAFMLSISTVLSLSLIPILQSPLKGDIKVILGSLIATVSLIIMIFSCYLDKICCFKLCR